MLQDRSLPHICTHTKAHMHTALSTIKFHFFNYIFPPYFWFLKLGHGFPVLQMGMRATPSHHAAQSQTMGRKPPKKKNGPIFNCLYFTPKAVKLLVIKFWHFTNYFKLATAVTQKGSAIQHQQGQALFQLQTPSLKFSTSDRDSEWGDDLFY